MATALEMAAGGFVLLTVGVGRGERFAGLPGRDGWPAPAYLTTLGSIVAFSAYMYLLNTVRPALATSYAYVNPVVAVVLGVTLGSQVLSGEAFVTLLILGGVALVAAARARAPEALPQEACASQSLDEPQHALHEPHRQVEPGGPDDQPEHGRRALLPPPGIIHGRPLAPGPGNAPGHR